MFSLAFKLLVSRRKWFILMCFSLSLILASILSIYTASESIKAGVKETAYQDYGEHSFVLFNSDESVKSLKKEKDVAEVGQYHFRGTVDLQNDRIATVGTMDKTALKLGRIKLVDGVYPTKSNEVVIEATYLTLLDKNWSIGESRVIPINGRDTTLVLTGIVKDYSAKWEIYSWEDTDIHDFPNIIMKEDDSLLNSAENYFLIKLNGSIGQQHEQYLNFIEKNNREAFFNNRLYDIGLTNYIHITKVSMIFRLFILLTTFICMFSLFSFFHRGQRRKLAIFKNLGATNKDICKIILSQHFIIFICSVIVAIPLQLSLHYMIIQNTFHVNYLNLSNVIYVFGALIIWCCVIALFIIWKAIKEVKILKKHSIYEMLKVNQSYLSNQYKLPDKFRHFTFKQILMQINISPKNSILIILTICLSILVVTFSIFIEKETYESWNDEQLTFYISSQETIAFEKLEGLNTLIKNGYTFSPEDVQKIENKPGVSYVEKIPFMPDFHPLLDQELITSNINDWIISKDETKITYNEKQVLPDVRYMLLNEREFSSLFPNKKYNELIGKAIIFIPNRIPDSNEEILKDKPLDIVRISRTDDGFKKDEWNYKILDEVHGPFHLQVDDTLYIEDEHLIVVLHEKEAYKNGLFNGYGEISVYLNEDINSTELKEVEQTLNRLIALTPGSLYQNLPVLFENDSKISLFVGYLGKIAFIVSMILSIINIVVVVFSKYKLQKKTWGIYMALGMKKRDTYYFLFNEMMLYFFVAVIISLPIFSLAVILSRSEYSTYSLLFYLQVFSMSALLILTFLSIGLLVIISVIRKDSIYSLIREEE